MQIFNPVDVLGKWAAIACGKPIQIGEVPVRTGDYALADRDGIVMIPAIASEVAQQAEELSRTENLVRKAILQGVDPVATYLQSGKF